MLNIGFSQPTGDINMIWKYLQLYEILDWGPILPGLLLYLYRLRSEEEIWKEQWNKSQSLFKLYKEEDREVFASYSLIKKFNYLLFKSFSSDSAS